jgi:RNA polymerase sigma factor (sigma-70 family)
MVQKRQSTVYIVDDDDAVRESLRALFQSVGITVETFASARAFLDSVDRSCSGCLVLDIRMPDLGGLALQTQLAEYQPQLPVIVITGHGDVATAVRAMKTGARDFIEKPCNAQMLLERVQACLDESKLAQQTLDRLHTVQACLDQLTPREREVMALLGQGKPSKTIAYKLGISVKTVDVHRSRLMDKLGVKSLAELLRLVLELERKMEH